MFKKASQTKKHLKILIYGPSGSGKTHLALTFPKPAVIDMEGGTDLFSDRFDFHVLKTKSYDEVIAAVDFVANSGDEFGTLILDPVTVLWQVLMEAGQLMAERRLTRRNQKADLDNAALTQRDWGIIKRKVNALYTRLVNMPCHVVVNGRIKNISETKGNEIVKVGERVDAEKTTEYMFDIIIKLIEQGGKRIGIVEKDRSGRLQGQRLENPTFDNFAAIVDFALSGTELATQQDQSEVAAKMAKTMDIQPTGKKGNGATRPLSPDKLRAFLHLKAGDDPTPVTEAQAPFVARKFTECYAPAEDAKKRYHLALNRLWNVDSANDLTESQANATLDWLLDPAGPDSTGDTPLHEHAADEAARVYRAALTEQGQQELEL